MKIKGVKIEAGLSKADEIKVFVSLHNAFYGTGNYLEHFFSDDVVNFVTRQIENDIIPASVIDRDKEVEELLRMLDEKQRLLDEAASIIGKLESELNEAKRVKHAAIENLNNTINRLDEENNALRRRNHSLQFRNDENEELRDCLRDFLRTRKGESNL